MNILAFMLDGDQALLPSLPIQTAAFLSPLVAVACCWLVRANKRFVSYAVALESVTSIALLAPLYQVAINNFDARYRGSELAIFWFLLGLPFIATAICYYLPARKPGKPTESVQS